MSAKNPYLQEVDYRPSSEGYDLMLVTSEHLETEKKLGLLVISEEGVVECVMDRERAVEAFDHPEVTPGIHFEPPPEAWDEALDAFNELNPREKNKALGRMERMRGRGMSGHIIIMEAVKNHVRHGRLPKAA